MMVTTCHTVVASKMLIHMPGVVQICLCRGLSIPTAKMAREVAASMETARAGPQELRMEALIGVCGRCASNGVRDGSLLPCAASVMESVCGGRRAK